MRKSTNLAHRSFLRALAALGFLRPTITLEPFDEPPYCKRRDDPMSTVTIDHSMPASCGKAEISAHPITNGWLRYVGSPITGFARAGWEPPARATSVGEALLRAWGRVKSSPENYRAAELPVGCSLAFANAPI